MKRLLILAGVLSLALSGCATFEEQCAAYGFQPGTEAMAQCVMTRHRDMSFALQNMANSMQQAKPTTCYTNSFGTGYSRSATTTCY